MSKFESVNVMNAANVDLDGKSNRTIAFSDATTKTLGLILAGEYTFNTCKPELMEIASGRVCDCLAGEDDWNDVIASHHLFRWSADVEEWTLAVQELLSRAPICGSIAYLFSYRTAFP